MDEAEVAAPETVRAPPGLAIVEEGEGEVTTVLGAGGLPPPGAKSYRKPSAPASMKLPSVSATPPAMYEPVW